MSPKTRYYLFWGGVLALQITLAVALLVGLFVLAEDCLQTIGGLILLFTVLYVPLCVRWDRSH